MYRDWTTPVTDQFADRLTHYVADSEVVLAAHSGAIRAVCGRFITPASMLTPEGELCPVCASMLGLVRPRGQIVRASPGCRPGLRRLLGLFTR